MSDATMPGPTAQSNIQPTPQAGAAATNVVIAGLDVPFGRLVVFFIKAGLAAIPALVIVLLSLGVAGAIMRGFFRFGYWGMHGGW